MITPPAATGRQAPMTQQDIFDDLHYLATVEHALAVEYLYAHYTVDAPYVPLAARSEDLSDRRYDFGGYIATLPAMTPAKQRNFKAAYEVFRVAVDEMRHLQWVNQALYLLNQPISIGRAEKIGRQFQRPFALEPLTTKQLDWFIEVEQVSQVDAPQPGVDQHIDGMYVHLLANLEKQPKLFGPELTTRLIDLIKLIIDEGQNHYERFLAVKQSFPGGKPDPYLRPPFINVPPELANWANLANKNYEVLLGHLALSFQLGERGGGALLQQARRAMFSLHEINHHFAAKGVKPQFNLPKPLPLPPTPPPGSPSNLGMVTQFINQMEVSISRNVDAVETTGGEGERALAVRQRQWHRALFAGTRQVIREHFST